MLGALLGSGSKQKVGPETTENGWIKGHIFVNFHLLCIFLWILFIYCWNMLKLVVNHENHEHSCQRQIKQDPTHAGSLMDQGRVPNARCTWGSNYWQPAILALQRHSLPALLWVSVAPGTLAIFNLIQFIECSASKPVHVVVRCCNCLAWKSKIDWPNGCFIPSGPNLLLQWWIQNPVIFEVITRYTLYKEHHRIMEDEGLPKMWAAADKISLGPLVILFSILCIYVHWLGTKTANTAIQKEFLA